MPLDHAQCRMERRLPIVVVVRLAQAECAGADGEERTYTDNISQRGARVYSIRPWQPGDAVQVTPRTKMRHVETWFTARRWTTVAL